MVFYILDWVCTAFVLHHFVPLLFFLPHDSSTSFSCLPFVSFFFQGPKCFFFCVTQLSNFSDLNSTPLQRRMLLHQSSAKLILNLEMASPICKAPNFQNFWSSLPARCSAEVTSCIGLHSCMGLVPQLPSSLSCSKWNTEPCSHKLVEQQDINSQQEGSGALPLAQLNSKAGISSQLKTNFHIQN